MAFWFSGYVFLQVQNTSQNNTQNNSCLGYHHHHHLYCTLKAYLYL